jgi:hypothetical protein
MHHDWRVMAGGIDNLRCEECWTVVLLAGIVGIIITSINQATVTTYAQFVVSNIVVSAASMFAIQPAPMRSIADAAPQHSGNCVL